MMHSRRYRGAVSLVACAALVASCNSAADRAADRAAPSTTPVAATPAPSDGSTDSSTDVPPAATTVTVPATTPATTVTTPGTGIATTESCGRPAVGVSEFTMTAGGADHPVRVFVPSGFSGVSLPTVLNWHGLGGDGPQQAAITGYEALAEAEGFIAVHPTGVPAEGDVRNSWQLASSSGDDARDDVAFAESLIDELIAQWCADADRIYSIGISNGGFFTARLICEQADRLAAAVSVAGLYHPDGCSPSRPVPYLAYHGTDDMVVPFDGDGESVLLGADPDPRLSVFFEQVMPAEFAEFADDAGCDPVPAIATFGDVISSDYSGCVGGTPMTFFEIVGGGHTWPNWSIAAAVEGMLGGTTTDADATLDSWAFFERHTLTS